MHACICELITVVTKLLIIIIIKKTTPQHNRELSNCCLVHRIKYLYKILSDI